MNEALLVLAGALVKTAFKVWIKEPLLAENVTDDLIDLLRDRVVGTANQRKVRRWVEDLEGIVDQRLSAFFDHEFKNLTDNEREAAVLAVADTFAGARLSDRSLFEVDLDSLQLERFLRGSCPTATRDLGEAATGVYARLLPEACAYVISLATTLPDFHVGSFTELLRRETTIITKLDEVLARLPRQDVFDSESQAGADRGFAEFTTAYRRQIVARLDHLRLFGLDIFTRRYPLTLAYISMHVLNGRAPTRSNTSSRSIVDLSREADRTIEDVLANSQRLFLRGQAGSGKTTLLQWLAVRAASKDFPGGLRAWNDLEPFFIPLRRFVEKKLPVPSHFVDFVGKNIADNMPLGWVNRKLSEGSGLILIDGVDELPAVRYEEVRQWLHILTSDYPDCKYVITSRPGAVGDNWLSHVEMSTATLAPMSSKTVTIFVHQWLEALRNDTIDVDERAQLEGYEESIVKALLTERHLRELATTPLLCALLCALYYARNGRLPHDRMGIYEAALDMLERRDPERGISSNVEIGRAECRIVLQDLAYWLVRNGLSDAEASRVLRQIDQSAKNLHQIAAEPSAIYQYLLLRSGLIQEPAAGRMSFVHRTFQEFLAAKAATDGDNIEELVAHALEPQWTQVVVLAAGHASPTQRQRLLGSLLRPHRRRRGDASALALIALACLETSPWVSAELLQGIRSAASSLIPPRTWEEVHILVRADSVALDILSDVPVESIEDAALTLEVACRIGSPESLSLVSHVLRQKPDIANTAHFLRVWESYDPREVARQVLSFIPEITSVAISVPRCEEALTFLEHVTAIVCLARGAVPDLSCLRDIPHLRVLLIQTSGVIDLRPLHGMKNLNITVGIGDVSSKSSSEELLSKYVVGTDALGVSSTVQAVIL